MVNECQGVEVEAMNGHGRGRSRGRGGKRRYQIKDRSVHARCSMDCVVRVEVFLDGHSEPCSGNLEQAHASTAVLVPW